MFIVFRFSYMTRFCFELIEQNLKRANVSHALTGSYSRCAKVLPNKHVHASRSFQLVSAVAQLLQN